MSKNKKTKTHTEILLDINEKQKTDFKKVHPKIDPSLFGQAIVNEYVRENGTVAVEIDYQYCPSLTEQHTAHLTDINYLMETYQPDEVANYILARSQYRREIQNHDFSVEPSLQESMNIAYKLSQDFEQLPDIVKHRFRTPLDYIKFIDNPKNAELMLAMGLLTPQQIQQTQNPTTENNVAQATTTQTT